MWKCNFNCSNMLLNLFYHLPNPYKLFFLRLSKEEWEFRQTVQQIQAARCSSGAFRSSERMVIIGQAGQRSRESNWINLLAGKIKNTPSTCREQNELPALIPRDAALRLYIHLSPGSWPRLHGGARRRVNEAENTPRAAGCQARSKGAATLPDPSSDREG